MIDRDFTKKANSYMQKIRQAYIDYNIMGHLQLGEVYKTNMVSASHFYYYDESRLHYGLSLEEIQVLSEMPLIYLGDKEYDKLHFHTFFCNGDMFTCDRYSDEVKLISYDLFKLVSDKICNEVGLSEHSKKY